MPPMPEIEMYQFGRMAVAGQTYTSDLVILPSGSVHGHWRRKSGHLLIQPDIDALIRSAPDLLVIGTGASGGIQIDSNLVSLLNRLGIKIEAHPTGRAVDFYNNAIHAETKMGACFHLTC